MDPMDYAGWVRLARESYGIPEPDPAGERPVSRIEDAVNAAHAVAEREE